MRNLILVALAAIVFAIVGCGGDSNKPLAPLSDEQKRKIAEEDKRVEDEESNGTAGKKKKAGKR
jgi:hypothetical protein